MENEIGMPFIMLPLLLLSGKKDPAGLPQESLKSFMADLEKAVVDLKRTSWSSTIEKGAKEMSQLGATVWPWHKHLWWDQRGRQVPKTTRKG